MTVRMKTICAWRIAFFVGLSLLIGGPAVQAASPTATISVTPAAATVTADQTQTYTVTATASDGTAKDVTADSTLSVNDPLGTVTGSTYRPGKAGDWTVQAVYQSFTASAAVIVKPGAPAEVSINPSSDPEQAYLGAPVEFSATVYDSHSNVVTGSTVTWSVVGDIGTIDKTGVFSPTKLGTGKVQAKVGNIVGEVAVQTNAALPTDTNTAANANTNAAKKTATAKNANATANKNENVNAAVVNVNASPANTNTSSAATTASCTTLKTWVWIVILLAFLAAVLLLYSLVPAAAIWPVIVALVGAGVLAYVQRKYGCGEQGWWAWIVTLGTIVLTAFNIRMKQNKPTA